MHLSPNIHEGRESYFLERRDACTDTFGNTSYSQTCAPTTLTKTLCCLETSSNIPFCHSQLGYGFCCTQDGGCYMDIDTSAHSICQYQNSTQCGQSCCPANTQCLPQSQYTYNTSVARCNLAANLRPSSIYPSSTPTATSTTVAATSSLSTSSIASNGAGSGSSSSGLSGGGIAGVVIGVIAGLVLIALAVFLLLRRFRRKRDQEITSDQPLYQDKKEIPQPDTPNEEPREMDGTSRAMEVDGSSRFVEAPGTIPSKMPSRKQGPTERQELPG